MAGLFVMLLALRLWWGWEANRRLQAEIDRIVAAGEPIFPEDFNPKEKTPDEENAATYYNNAASAIVMTADDENLLKLIREHPDQLPAKMESLKEFFRLNEGAINEIRRAGECSTVDWGLRFASPAVAAMFPNYSAQRSVTRLMCGMAWHQHLVGDDRGAVESVHQALIHARFMTEYPTLIGQLVAIAITAFVIDVLERSIPTMMIEVAPSAQVGTPADIGQIQSVIRELLNEEPSTRNFTRSMMHERMVFVDFCKVVTKNTGSFPALTGGAWPLAPLGFFTRPLIVSDAYIGTRIHHGVLEATRSPFYSLEIEKALDRERLSAVDRLLRPASTAMLGSVEHSVALHFRVRATRRMAAIALAIRLYKLEFAKEPDQLSDLVPDL